MTLLMRDRENLEKGIQQGIGQGEERLAELSKKLIQAKRYDALERVYEDKEYRRKLYEEYHIIEK